jgi:hypothetical protein
MSAMAAALMFLLAQDGTTTAPDALNDAETAILGGFAAEKIDATPAPDELTSFLQAKLDEIRKARSEKKDEPAKGKKRKKADKAAAKKSRASSPDTIKNGLIEADRLALGKLALSEIAAGHKGEELLSPLKKELERLRAERVKASSTAEAPKKKRKKKADS